MSIDRLIIEIATITAADGFKTYQIARSISDMVLYEHIDKPYITGTVQFLDTYGVLDEAQFKGIEQFDLTLKFPEDDRPSIKRKFIIDRIIDTSKNNDNSELITFHIIEEAGFISSFLNVNKAYSGTPREIVNKIITDHFPNTKLSKEDEDIANYPLKLIVPNMTPLEAANWVKDRTTSSFGTPYYLFSTLMQPNLLHFLPLSTMIAAPVPDTREYIYSQSTTSSANNGGKDPLTGYYVIQDYRQNPLQISNLIDAGLISSKQGYWDTSLSADFSTTFEIENSLGIIPNYNRDNFKFKNKYQYKDQLLNTIQSRKQYAIHASYPYPENVSFRELENLNRTITSKAIRNILTSGSIDIAVSGRNFSVADQNRTIGNLINLKFLNNQTPTTTTDIHELTDKVKSGKHMIYAARHNIRTERYDVTLTCVKLENLK
jgi:hypothetical protein